MQVVNMITKASPVIDKAISDGKAIAKKDKVGAVTHAIGTVRNLIVAAEEIAEEAKAGATKKAFVIQAFGQILSSCGARFLGLPRWVGWFVSKWFLETFLPVLIDKYVGDLFPNESDDKIL